MDSAVSVKKFDGEVRSLQTDAAAYAAARGWKVAASTFPLLAVVLRHSGSGREVEFQFACDDWDELPPSLTLHHPDGGGEFTWADWPKNGWSVGDPHPLTGKPFLCLPGIREYHTHPSHLSELWEGYRHRSSYSLRSIVDRVQQRFEDSDG